MAIPGTLSLVLPAHNEVLNLEAVVRRALEVLPELTENFEIIVVDDGSRDGTAELADRLAAESPRVRVVHHPVNRGYGAALTSGFQAATGDYIMFMDADQQFDPADLAHLAPFVPQADIVAGYRIERRDPWIRLVYARIFNLCMRLLFGLNVRDIDCAFKIYRADLLKAIEITTAGALINTELLVKARRAGATIVEVGVRHFPRPTGESSGGSPRVILRAMRETIWLWWHMLGYRPPAVPTRGQPIPARLFLVRALALAAIGIGALAATTAWVLRRRG
ncbi:glycosyltransferase family 2 protein [Thermomicrobiaceae bacterium CFH 74404]|uniref:Glycosyltransferase family 2 protein n=1 Tax=Thermalbibacter longus TaxID=2951981 RepID=A0AA42B9A2_9BACT|nr:glycosyltransferase family 2 protein [Thermalbibacter longus]MCM8748231.1 glycosyltransferase family 2 protein [Thermalbibacter longus]